MTSVAHSSATGWVALGYVRRGVEVPATLRAGPDGPEVEVRELPGLAELGRRRRRGRALQTATGRAAAGRVSGGWRRPAVGLSLALAGCGVETLAVPNPPAVTALR